MRAERDEIRKYLQELENISVEGQLNSYTKEKNSKLINKLTY
jgi:hypothetical protein